MRGKMKTCKLIVLMMMVLGGSILFPKMLAFAGEINGNEASVISAASGTFTYNGKSYKAGTSYINSLIGYLSSDDVDLTADQAAEAINMMYGSIAEGVSQGYLYEVGGSETDSSADDSEHTYDAEGVDDKEDSKNTDEKEPKNTDKNQNESSTTESEVDVWEAMSNPTENKKKLEERPKKKDAEASLELQREGIVVTTKDKETISISKDKPIISNRLVMIISILAGIMLGITVICGIILFATKCMTFKKQKGRKARPGHSKRRKIRHYTRAVMTVTTAISLFGILILIGLYVSLFNNDAIMQNMQSSGYFRYAYSEYITKQAEEMLSGGNLKEALLNAEEQKIQTYDEYLFTIKQNSLKVLGGDLEVIIPDSNVAPYVYNLKECYNDIFKRAGLFMIGSVVFGIILMIYMDQRRERGVKHIAVSMLMASFVMAIITFVMLVYKPYTLFYIEPDYLYLFLMECIKRCVTALTVITSFGVVVGMLCIGVYRTMLSK